MRRWYAVALLLVVAAAGPFGSARRAEAQDARAAADRYAASVIVTGTEVSGYTGERSVVLPPEGEALAKRGARFAAAIRPGDPPSAFTVYVSVYPNADVATRVLDQFAYTGFFTFQVAGLSVPNRLHALTGPAGSDAGKLFLSVAGAGDLPGTAAGAVTIWRRGAVLFEVDLIAAPADRVQREIERVANVQDTKAVQTGPFGDVQPRPVTPAPLPATTPVQSAPANPPPTASPPATTAGTPRDSEVDRILAGLSMTVFATVSNGTNRYVPNGTRVQAVINGKVCATDTALNGWVLLIVPGTTTSAGCGSSGATVTFVVDGETVRQGIPWTVDTVGARFIQPVALTTTAASAEGGRGAQSIFEPECRTRDGGACSAHDRDLWNGDLLAWEQEADARGVPFEAEGILVEWARFRAERGEILGAWFLAVLTETPFTFTAAVQYGASAAEPRQYISLLTVGAPQPVRGWRLGVWDSAAGDAPLYQFQFNDGELPTGECRIYANPAAAPAGESLCSGRWVDAPGGRVILPPRGYLFVGAPSADSDRDDALPSTYLSW